MSGGHNLSSYVHIWICRPKRGVGARSPSSMPSSEQDLLQLFVLVCMCVYLIQHRQDYTISPNYLPMFGHSPGLGQRLPKDYSAPPVSKTLHALPPVARLPIRSVLTSKLTMCKSMPIRDSNTGTKQLRCFALPLELIDMFYTRDNFRLLNPHQHPP